MASALFLIKTGAGSTRRGTSLLNILEQLRNLWSQLEAEREQMIQSKDGATDYTTTATIYGFIDSQGAVSEPTAEAAFAELDSMIGNGAAALKQACARFLQ